MKQNRRLQSEGNSPSKLDYGKALMNQKGGWTLAELKPGRKNVIPSETELSHNTFDRVLRQVSRRVSEPASRKNGTSE